MRSTVDVVIDTSALFASIFTINIVVRTVSSMPLIVPEVPTKTVAVIEMTQAMLCENVGLDAEAFE